jgi:hypothetical protein
MNLLRALLEAYIHKFQVIFLGAGALTIAAGGATFLSKFITSILELRPESNEFLLPLCFLVIAAGEFFAYQRYLRWRFFKDLTK